MFIEIIFTLHRCRVILYHQEINERMNELRLNIGCGTRHLKGYINIDKDSHCNPDIILDSSKYRLPFRDSTVSRIQCRMMLEHINNPMQLLDEFNRVLKTYGLVDVLVPHLSHAYSLHGGVGVHVTRFGVKSFEALTEERSYTHTRQWSHVQCRIVFPKGSLKIISYPIERLVNSNRTTQKIYELSCLQYIYPAMDLKVKMIK